MSEVKSAAVTDAALDKAITNTGAVLAAQPKQRVKIYLAPEERQKLEQQVAAGKKIIWPYTTVQINGYTYQIQLGKEVEVPESVAEVLKQANMI